MRLALLLLALALPALALAEEVPLPFTYTMFEQSVPHVDLAVCPEPLAAPGRFCRITLFNDEMNVFVFSEEGDQPLVDFRTWSSDLLEGLMD
jgi:hypothetical protein